MMSSYKEVSQTIDAMRRIVAGIEGWLSDREADFLYRTARDCVKGGVILEIGSWKGKSTVCLAMGSRAGRGLLVFAVDPHINTLEQNMWLGGKSSFEEFKANINKAGVSDLVIPIVKTSEEVAKDWNRPISFLWIDGDHSYRGAKLDFDLFSRWVVEGGVIAFHDSTQGDVPRVVCETFGGKGFTKVGLVDSITYATKSPAMAIRLKDRFILFLVSNYDRARKIWGIKKVKPFLKGLLARI